MQHEDKILQMKLTVDFNCFGREAELEFKLGMKELTNPVSLRLYIDARISEFLKANRPVIRNS